MEESVELSNPFLPLALGGIYFLVPLVKSCFSVTSAPTRESRRKNRGVRGTGQGQR